MARPVDPEVPFERLGHLLTVPVSLGAAVESRFVLDTGIGLTLVSRALVDRAGVRATSEVATGRRMSGQRLSSPIGRLPELVFGGRRWRELNVATLDMGAFHPMLRDLGGFLSLSPFVDLAFTIDQQQQVVRLHPEGRPAPSDFPGYEEVALYPVWEGPALSVQTDLELPTGERARVEVDSGSDSLILHERYMGPLGVDPASPAVKTVEGVDETGHRYVRYFASVRGAFRIRGTTEVVQRDPAVMFQRIIYDGLIGDAFLRRFDVTFDLARSRIGFVPHPG
jgi:hypothetical protein